MESNVTQPAQLRRALEITPPAKDAVHLLAAARNGALPKIRELIEKQHYQVDMLGEDGFTALMLAVMNKRAPVVEYLVKAGADVFAKNALGECAYNMAKQLCNSENNAEVLVYNAIHGQTLALGECKICFENDVSLYTLPCGDQACVECIRNWFNSLLDDNDILKCPSAECQEMPQDEVEPPDEQDARRLLSVQDYERYDRQLLNRLLVTTRDFQFCTACPSGGFFEKGCSEITCESCDVSWCKDCRLPAHPSMTCSEFEKEYAPDHAANMKCMAENCKKCPKCKSQVERDGGCSHMTCSLCRFQFCYICLGKYRPGQYTFEDNGECPCDKDDLTESGGWA
jgi:hypothetical protein